VKRLQLDICSCAEERILPSRDIYLCNKKCGINPPKPISGLPDRWFCVATVFDKDSKHVVPEAKAEIERMSYCLYREMPVFFEE